MPGKGEILMQRTTQFTILIVSSILAGFLVTRKTEISATEDVLNTAVSKRFSTLLKSRYGVDDFSSRSPYEVKRVELFDFVCTDEMKKEIPQFCQVLGEAQSFKVRFSRNLSSANWNDESDSRSYDHLEIDCIVLFWVTDKGRTKCWWLDGPSNRNFEFLAPLPQAKETDPPYLRDWFKQTAGWIHNPPGGYASKARFESDLPVFLVNWSALLERPMNSVPTETLEQFRDLITEFDIPGALESFSNPRIVAKDSAGNFLITSGRLDELWLLSIDEDACLSKEWVAEPVAAGDDESRCVYRLTKPVSNVKGIFEQCARFINGQSIR